MRAFKVFVLTAGAVCGGLWATSSYLQNRPLPEGTVVACPEGTSAADVNDWTSAVANTLLHIQTGKPLEDTVDQSLFSDSGWVAYKQALQQGNLLDENGVGKDPADLVTNPEMSVEPATTLSSRRLGASYMARFTGELTITPVDQSVEVQKIPWAIELAIGCDHSESTSGPFTIERVIARRP